MKNNRYKESNKKYSFNEEVAKDVGLEEAIMLHNINHWVNHNSLKDGDDYFHEGKNWMYCTVREFTEIYPFWTSAQIKRILNNLKRKEYIDDGEFNKWSPDRTKWYTTTPKALSMIENDKALAEIINS